MNNKDIDLFIQDVNEVANRIKSIDSLICKLESQELQDHYRKDMLNLIDEYKIMCGLLKEVIEKHMENLNNEGINVVNLMYTKVLKSLKE